MISCKEAAFISSKNQYREANLKERIQLWMHLLACKACAAFARRNKQLTQLCKEASVKMLSPEEKKEMKALIEQS
ncbi:MAG: hypothetical protein P8X60_04580 [Robiginitalea sp.]|jgi:hypothetical protein